MDIFLKLKYGNIKEIDVHGKTLEDARADVLYMLSSVDSGVDGLLVVHGYHSGTVIRNYFRHKFSDPRVIKVVASDAGETLLILSENLALK
ncbi:MAG: Smr/MutS family protein [Clostridia bacterium]|nr:Smr/MutS family protein [Clostridia bacterium]